MRQFETKNSPVQKGMHTASCLGDGHLGSLLVEAHFNELIKI